MESFENLYPNNPLVLHAVNLALHIIRFSEDLARAGKYAVLKQLIRSGTAVGELVMEAQSAESKADFIHKLKIADKEARETWYWLYLCKNSEGYPFNETIPPLLKQIQLILHSILKKGK